MNKNISAETSAQEVFDRVVTHLRAQNAKSISFNFDKKDMTCRYRGDNGTSCAVGCLIPDEDYDPIFEGINVCGFTDPTNNIFSLFKENNKEELLFKMKNMFKNHVKLLGELQYVHDQIPTKDWEVNFQRCAYDFKLNFQPLK